MITVVCFLRNKASVPNVSACQTSAFNKQTLLPLALQRHSFPEPTSILFFISNSLFLPIPISFTFRNLQFNSSFFALEHLDDLIQFEQT
jgi:hypothetical protein